MKKQAQRNKNEKTPETVALLSYTHVLDWMQKQKPFKRSGSVFTLLRSVPLSSLSVEAPFFLSENVRGIKPRYVCCFENYHLGIAHFLQKACGFAEKCDFGWILRRGFRVYML